MTNNYEHNNEINIIKKHIYEENEMINETILIHSLMLFM